MTIVAHDLKSPWNKIQGLSSLLKMDGELTVNQKQYAQLLSDKTDGAYSVAQNLRIKLKRFLQSVHVKSDKEYLGKIVDNLVSNAIKFLPSSLK